MASRRKSTVIGSLAVKNFLLSAVPEDMRKELSRKITKLGGNYFEMKVRTHNNYAIEVFLIPNLFYSLGQG